jgi:type VI secretion system protein ImpG
MTMDSLLPYYEREIDFLQNEAHEFGRRYPRVAANLRLSDRGSEDPHIGRLMEAMALLTARVNMRLGDDYAGFAENLLDALYPQHAKPRPACAVARFNREPDSGAGAIPSEVVSPAGTVRSVKFTVLSKPRVSDPDVVGVQFHGMQTLALRDGTTWSGVSLSIRFDGAIPPCIRLFVHGEPSLASTVRDAFCFDVADVLVRDPSGTFVGGGGVSWAAPEAADATEPSASHAHPGYELLRDLFTFPDKFGFFDIRLPGRVVGPVSEVRLLLASGDHGSRDAVLARVDRSNLVTRCAPLVNLYGASVTFGPRGAHRSQYTVPATRPGMAVVSVLTAYLRGSQGTKDEVVPHYYHGRRPNEDRTGCFWVCHPGGPTADDPAPEGSVRLMLVDDERRPAVASGTLTANATCCDSDLPARLICGTPSGLLYGGARDVSVAELVTSPTRYVSAPARKDANWHLISHLRLSQSSLLGPDASVLREFLALHAPAISSARHAIDGVVGVTHRSVTQWMPGAFPPTLARGTEITLTFDETYFVGIGLHAWVHVLDRFFAGYAQINTFTQLVIRSSLSGKEIHRCSLATGTGPLI